MSQAVCMSALPTLNFCLPQLIVCQRSVRVAPKQCVQVGQHSVDVLPGRAWLTTDPKLIGSSCSATIGMARLACRITIAAFVFPANHTVGLEPKMGSAQTPSGFVYGYKCCLASELARRPGGGSDVWLRVLSFGSDRSNLGRVP